MQILKAFSCCATVHTVLWCELAEIKIQESKTVLAQNTERFDSCSYFLHQAIYGFCSASAGTTTPFSSSIFANDPSWCMLMRISQPPTNSLSTYNCGIVGHSEYSLIPAQRISLWYFAAQYLACDPRCLPEPLDRRDNSTLTYLPSSPGPPTR
jgi:hypothetical protein